MDISKCKHQFRATRPRLAWISKMRHDKKMFVAQSLLSLTVMMIYVPESYAIGGPNGYGPQVDTACSAANGTTPFSTNGCSLCHVSDRSVTVEPEWTAFHSIGPTAFCDQAPDSVITAPANNTTVNKNDSVAFKGDVSGTAPDPIADPPPISYNWNFADGTSSTDQNPAHIFTTAGTFNVTLTTTDGKNRSDETPAKVSIKVVDTNQNQPPNGTIVTPANDVTIQPGQSIQFSGAATDPENDTSIAYLWNFGDGTATSTSTNPVHTYDLPGLFTALLTVTDSMGLSDPTPASRTITVASSSTACTDNDQDMFSPEGGVCGPIDCNDYDASINPGAIEACGDHIDNDCNGDTDKKDAHCSGTDCIGDLLKQVEILKAKWDRDERELSVKGTWDTKGAIVELSDAMTGEVLGTTKVSGSKGSGDHEDSHKRDNRNDNGQGKTYFWKFELENPKVVPCRIRVEIDGRIGERDVAYAPADCSGQPPVTNTPPRAKDDDVSTTKKVPVVIPVLANDTDEDGDKLTIVMFTQPQHGLVVQNDEKLTYTPKGGFTGNDSFTYMISDQHGGTDQATVHVTIKKQKSKKGDD